MTEQEIVDILIEERNLLEGDSEFAYAFKSGMTYCIGIVRGLIEE